MKTCLKRFRYKGDLSKHIRRYHPGHQQELVPLPLQPDEILTLQATVKKPPIAVFSSNHVIGLANANATAQSIITTATSVSNSLTSKSSSATVTSGSVMSSNKYFFPLLPQHPVKQSELTNAELNGMTSILPPSNLTSEEDDLHHIQIMDDNDPSLDENILNMLTEDVPSSPPPLPTITQPSASHFSSSMTSSCATSTPILHDVLTRGAASAKPKDRLPPPSLPPPPPPPPPPQVTHNTFIVPAALLKQTSVIAPHSMHRTTSSGIRFCLPSQPTLVSPQTTRTVTSIISPTRPPPQFVRQSGSTPITMTLDQVLACVQPVVSVSGEAVKTAVSPIKTTTHVLEVKLPTEPATLTAAATALLPARPAKPFPCDHPGCNRSFEKATLLRRHQKLHSGNCKYVCDVCKKCFESQSKIDDHYRKHTGEKPFVCHVCGNAFRYKGKHYNQDYFNIYFYF